MSLIGELYLSNSFLKIIFLFLNVSHASRLATHLGSFLLVSATPAGKEMLTPASSKVGQSLHLQQKTITTNHSHMQVSY